MSRVAGSKYGRHIKGNSVRNTSKISGFLERLSRYLKGQRGTSVIVILRRKNVFVQKLWQVIVFSSEAYFT